jgi:hypothetical protein
MILLPSDLVQELDASDLDRILLHELAHVRRADDWVNLFERIAQALFFFSPGIYWISRQMDLEREVACDDWVLEQSTENVPYARCLARIVELTRWPYTAPATPGVFVTRKSMSIRIERLLARGRDIRLRLTLVPTLLSLTLIAAIVVAGGLVSPTIAYTIDRGVLRRAPHAPAHHVVRVATAVLPPRQQAAAATAPPALVKPRPTTAAPPTPDTKVKVKTKVAAKKVASWNAADSRTRPDLASGSGSGSNSGSDSGPGSGSTSTTLVADENYLDDLAALGYKNLTVDEVIELKSVGVDREYIESLQRAGYKNLTPHELVQLKSLNVTGEYIAAMRNAGLVDVDPRQLVALKSLNVDAGYITSLAAAGLTGLSARELTELKSLGIDGAFVKDLADNGYPHLSAREYVQLKSLGVDGGYVRKLASHGFAHLTVDQLVRYKSLGISPQ